MSKWLTVEARMAPRHLVLAWLNEPVAQADLVQVEVGDNRNFRAGQRIECVPASGSVWKLVGNAPKSRRDWVG